MGVTLSGAPSPQTLSLREAAHEEMPCGTFNSCISLHVACFHMLSSTFCAPLNTTKYDKPEIFGTVKEAFQPEAMILVKQPLKERRLEHKGRASH
jgi:hypothetical protein